MGSGSDSSSTSDDSNRLPIDIVAFLFTDVCYTTHGVLLLGGSGACAGASITIVEGQQIIQMIAEVRSKAPWNGRLKVLSGHSFNRIFHLSSFWVMESGGSSGA